MYQATQNMALLICLMLAGIAPAAAQTCRSDIPPTHPSGRLIDQRNGTVTDSATGLMWKQCAEGRSDAGCATGIAEGLTWQQALQRGADSTFAGYLDWRLPNKNELESLVERRCYGPAINATAFPNTPAQVFWSSSPFANASSGGAWVIDFDNGNAPYGIKSSTHYVRLVRGVQ